MWNGLWSGKLAKKLTLFYPVTEWRVLFRDQVSLNWIAFLLCGSHTGLMKQNYTILVLILSSLVFSAGAWAEPSRILLNDGTEIVGELVSLHNGSYTIRSKTLGTLKISERQVSRISSMGAVAAAVSPVESAKSVIDTSTMQSIQQRLMGDASMVQQIMSLQSNPDMQAVLSDPEIMAAIQRLDFDTLTSHPKIQKLMQNRDVQAISGSVN
ncbi:MAG: hypothetical protein ACI9B8_003736 [Sulfitobacter sp.]